MAFCGYLKQSTAVDILLGPFLDDGDGDTADTDATLDVEVSKNGQAIANKNDATTPTHDANGDVTGYYNCELDATDTNTLGILTVVCHHADDLPVRQDYQIVVANWYDSMCSTDTLQADVQQWLGQACHAVSENGVPKVDLDQIGGVVQRATDLAEIAQYLIANSATLTSVIADNSILAQIMAESGDISDYNNSTDSLEAIRNNAQTACDNAIVANNLDHLMKTPVANNADMTTEVPDGTVLSNIMTKGSDTSDFTVATDSLEGQKDTLVSDIIAGIADGAYDLQEMLRIMFAALAGKSTGGGTGSHKFRDSADSKDRISATVDTNGNRTSMTLDGS